MEDRVKMKKSFRSLALVLAVVLLVSVIPFSAFAADLTKTENKYSNAEYYSVTLQNADTPSEYISFQYTGVDKDTKTLTVKEYEPITITMDDGSGYTGQNGDQNGYALGWYYSSGSGRCISTESSAWSMTDATGTYSFEISGFGASGENWCTSEVGNSCASTLSLASGLPAGDYEFTVSYKYQMKKWDNGVWGMGAGWKTQQELSTSDVIKIHVEKNIPAEYYPNTEGGSIRVGSNSGLRFGFTTDADASIITEYGFLYAVGSHDSLTEGADGVTKKVATNFVTHDEDTDAEYTSFNLVFTDVPSSGFDTNITACAYVVIDGETYYSEPATRSFRQVANDVLADPTVDEATKEAVRDMLGE